jgi:hypothetical protein
MSVRHAKQNKTDKGNNHIPTKIYLGLHGALAPGEGDGSPTSVGNMALDDLGEHLGCPVDDWPAATHPDPNDWDPYSSKPMPAQNLYRGFPGYVPSEAVKYLIGQIKAAKGPTSIRLFGWSTGAIMLCRIAESLSNCPVIPAASRTVDLCFAVDPLWSGAALGQFPKIPKNVARWLCLRQNRNGTVPPTHNPTEKAFWQGVRLDPEDTKKTRYDEINVATGVSVGNPGFALPAMPDVTHGQMPGVANPFMYTVLTS